MCANHFGVCLTPQCKRPTDCRYDPFCKECRVYWYDNPDQNVGRSKYEAGEVGSSDVTSKYEVGD